MGGGVRNGPKSDQPVHRVSRLKWYHVVRPDMHAWHVLPHQPPMGFELSKFLLLSLRSAMVRFAALPLDSFSEHLTVHMIAPLRALDKEAARSFQRTFTPRFLVCIVRAKRNSGRLSLAEDYALAFKETPLKSRTLIVAIDVPIDLAASYGASLAQKLRAHLPGQRKLWNDGAAIVGLSMKKPRGKQDEFLATLRACLGDDTKYVCMTDMRIARELPFFLGQSNLEVLHCPRSPNCELRAKLQGFAAWPKALCFHRGCVDFLRWAAEDPLKAKSVETLGDVILSPLGLDGTWCCSLLPGLHVRSLGLSMTSGRHGEPRSAWWNPGLIAGIMLEAFPNITTVALHLEVSCACQKRHQAAMMKLLQIFVAKDIHVVSFDVVVIQLPSSARKQEDKVRQVSEQLLEAGVHMSRRARARSTTEMPCDGFAVPAALHLAAPPAVCRATAVAVWDAVW